MYEFCGRVDADGQPEAWFVLEDGVVVGDAGTHGPPNENGDVEIGSGPSSRGPDSWTTRTTVRTTAPSYACLLTVEAETWVRP